MNQKEWLEQHLERRQWSYAELGRRAGVNTSTVSRWASGEGYAEATVRIALALGVSLEEAFRASGNYRLPNRGRNEDEVAAIMRSVTDDGRDLILSYARYVLQTHPAEPPEPVRQPAD